MAPLIFPFKLATNHTSTDVYIPLKSSKPTFQTVTNSLESIHNTSELTKVTKLEQNSSDIGDSGWESGDHLCQKASYPGVPEQNFVLIHTAAVEIFLPGPKCWTKWLKDRWAQRSPESIQLRY